ncbi:extracellular protease domain-containing protein [Corallococcus macrosporus]|uniref:Extracellular protease domain-containing protein n=1 Tax=Myxococcus fulvus (strain ATCC BAA-855 / HW-1) TaxID=483219 RepID=F8CBP9_MYXFH|nr:extracellular protease domain-containing protein [Corallococcus macrosporus]
MVLALGMLGGACAARQDVTSAPATAQPTKEEQAVGTTLTCKLSGPEQARAGEPVELTFELGNPTAQSLRVLAWHTPLEGVRNKIFEVSRDGAPLDYQGPMAKRAPPAADSYVTLSPGTSVEGKVDLARFYDLQAPGTYRIAFRGPLMDVAREGEPVPAPNGGFRPADVPCPEVLVTVTP